MIHNILKLFHRKKKYIDININVIKQTNNTYLIQLFENKMSLPKLIKLYHASQMEHKRNGRLTADVGMSREKDIIAYMKYILGETVNYKIDNEKEEDVLCDGRKISIKHSSVKTLSNASIKLQWTENKERQKQFIKTFKFTCDLLIVYVRFKETGGEIEILYCTVDILNELLDEFKETKEDVFKMRENSNGRGIEFSRNFFEAMIKNCNYNVKIYFDDLEINNVDSITRRLNELNQF